MTRLVFFDLDGTILGGKSSEHAFFFHLLKKGKIGFRQLFAASWFLLRWVFKYGIYIFIKDKAYLSGLSVSEISILAENFVQENLLHKIRPHIKEYIDKHHQNNDIVILLTGSHEFLATVFAKALNIDHVEATKCVQCDGRFTSAPPLQHPFHAEKVKIAERLCEQYQTKMQNCFAYGNSINDQWILKAIGHPVAVTPQKRLCKLAQKNHWQIIS